MVIGGMLRDPIRAFEQVGARSAGRIVRLNLGLFHPYLVTRPEHVQHVLVDNVATYRRDGMLWQPVRRLVGDGLGGDDAGWQASRELLLPLFSGRNIAALSRLTARAVGEAVAELDGPARTGQPVDAAVTMTRVVNRAAAQAFFGGRISPLDAERLGDAIARAFTSLGARMLLPFVPGSVPLPGSQTFDRAVRIVDGIIYPLIERYRPSGTDPDTSTNAGTSTSDGDGTSTGDLDDGPGAGADGVGDLVSLLCRARGPTGRRLTDRQIRDDLVAIYVAGSETMAVALTWLWVILDRHPEVVDGLRDETGGPGNASLVDGHLPARLPYTRMVLQELLRLYPSAWIIPRRVVRADRIAGVRLSAGSTVLVSPYLTQRLPALWEQPEQFRPERFTPERVRQRHRFAYFPFGAGPHQCLGTQFFMMEAQLIVAAMLRRFRITVPNRAIATPQAAATLRPRRPIHLLLSPAREG